MNFWFEDFNLTGLEAIRFQPLSDKILIRTLRDDTQRELARATAGPREALVENYIVRHLIDFDQVDYDSQSDLLYKLAGQAVDHLRTYLSSEDDVENVALAHGKAIAAFIFEQMKKHYRETPTDYQVKRVRAFRMLRPQHFSIANVAKRSHIKNAVTPLADTKGYIFYGSQKSPYSQHKFDSDAERRFAALIDSDFEKDVQRWLKPGAGQFGIEYRAGKTYEPDFVIESTNEKVIVEVKSDKDMTDPTVLEKARAASEWVKHANSLDQNGPGKPWSYAIIPDSGITQSATLAGLLAAHRRT